MQPMISADELRDLLQKLVRIDSSNPPGREEPVADVLADVMSSAGMEVTQTPLAAGRANVVGRWRGTGDRAALLFSGHTDTVPVTREQWRLDPHAGIVEGDILHGRGSVDMKGGLAAMLMACAALARSGTRLTGDLILAATAGEEVDCLGARHLLTHDLGPVAALVVAEPTRLEVIAAHKGALWLEVTTTGKAAHAAMPDQGYNAITAMHRLVSRLLEYRPAYRSHPLLGSPTINLGTIQGGVKTNIVPDLCHLTIDMRTVPGQQHEQITGDIQQMIAAIQGEDAAFQATVRVVNDRSPVETSVDDPLIQTALCVGKKITGGPLKPKGISYFTDASVLAPGLGVPTLIMGPGDERLAHQVDEHVSLSMVASAARFYLALAQAYLS